MNNGRTDLNLGVGTAAEPGVLPRWTSPDGDIRTIREVDRAH